MQWSIELKCHAKSIRFFMEISLDSTYLFFRFLWEITEVIKIEDTITKVEPLLRSHLFWAFYKY